MGPTKPRWAFPLAATFLLVILFTSFNAGLISSRTALPIQPGSNRTKPARLPRLAYSISGSRGDLDRLWRTLLALYHPGNHYLLHLDLDSPLEERLELVRRVEGNEVFGGVGNVRVIEKANMMTYRGVTMVANTLHACAIMLKEGKEWDWFVNLSASDYPLVTQDDVLRVFQDVPRDVNFVEHTSKLGWKAKDRARPIIVDPGLYSNRKSDVFWVTQKRELPTAFKLFTGSAWTALTREFVEYCVWGWDNLPRTLLMYYTNFLTSPEGYFQTVICNNPNFSTTAVNHDLHYISWDVPPKQHPHILSLNDTAPMLASGAPFARKFAHNDPVLDWIDSKLLKRHNGSFTPGGWCSGDPKCSEVGDITKLQLDKGYERMATLVKRLLETRGQGQCR